MKDIVKKGDWNLKESLKSRADNIKTGEYIETEDYIIATIGEDFLDGNLNSIMCLNDEKGKEVYKIGEEYFGAKKIQYIAWVLENENPIFEKELISNGKKLKRETGTPGMAIYNRIEEKKIKEGYREEQIVYGKNHMDFVKVTGAAFEKPIDIAEKMFNDKKTVETENISGIVIYKGETPVGGALTIKTDDIAGIYWVGVIDSERGNGIGAYVVQQATNKGFDLGSRAVILQASEKGEPLYKKLGYETIRNYKLYY